MKLDDVIKALEEAKENGRIYEKHLQALKTVSPQDYTDFLRKLAEQEMPSTSLTGILRLSYEYTGSAHTLVRIPVKLHHPEHSLRTFDRLLNYLHDKNVISFLENVIDIYNCQNKGQISILDKLYEAHHKMANKLFGEDN